MAKDQTFLFLINRIHRLASREFNKRLDSVGMTHGLAAVLLHLDLIGEGTTQGRIAQSMEIENPTVVQLVSKLIKMNFLEKKPYPGDKRKFAIYFTASGRRMLSDLETIYQNTYQKLFGHLRRDDLDRAERLLTVLYDNSKSRYS